MNASNALQAFPEGEWTHEPDELEWRDEASGLPCLMLRHCNSGAWCGYVAVSKEHPLHGKHWQDYMPASEWMLEEEREAAPNPIAMLCSDHERVERGEIPLNLAFDVHGSVTFGAPAPKYDTDGQELWWFGFACNHCGDFLPTLGAWNVSGYVYRNVAYVKGEVRRLAAQLRRVAEEGAQAQHGTGR